AIAEEVHDLTVDRPRRIGPQRHAARGVVAVDRLDQADVAGLLDVLERQAAAVVPARDRAHQARVPHHQLLAGRGVATLAMRGNQLDVGAMCERIHPVSMLLPGVGVIDERVRVWIHPKHPKRPMIRSCLKSTTPERLPWWPIRATG